MKCALFVLVAFFHAGVFASEIVGTWVGQGDANGITIRFLPGERWISSLEKKGGIYVVDGNTVTIDKFFEQRVKGRFSGNELSVPFNSLNLGRVNFQFRRGNALDHQDASVDATVKPKVSEMVLAMASCRTLIGELYPSGGTQRANGWGCEGKSQYGRTETSAYGKITFRVNSQLGVHGIDGRVITMVPLIGGKPTHSAQKGASISDWRCGAKHDLESGQLMVDSKYLPSTCGGGR